MSDEVPEVAVEDSGTKDEVNDDMKDGEGQAKRDDEREQGKFHQYAYVFRVSGDEEELWQCSGTASALNTAENRYLHMERLATPNGIIRSPVLDHALNNAVGTDATMFHKPEGLTPSELGSEPTIARKRSSGPEPNIHSEAKSFGDTNSVLA